MTKKLIKKPVQVSKRFLNKEAMDRSRRIEIETGTKPYELQPGDPSWMTGVPLIVSTKTDKGPTLQAVVDEFLSLEARNTSETGDLGEKALEVWSGGSNLNIDSGNFPFADVVEDKVTHQIYWSVKATTTDRVPFDNSKVEMATVWSLAKQVAAPIIISKEEDYQATLNYGDLSKENFVENDDNYKPIGLARYLHLGIVGVRKVLPGKGKLPDAIRDLNYADRVYIEIKKWGPVSILVKWYRKEENGKLYCKFFNAFNTPGGAGANYGNADQSQAVVNAIYSKTNIKSLSDAKNLFGDPPEEENIIRIPTKISREDIERRVAIRNELQDLLLRLDNDQFEKAIKYIKDEILSRPGSQSGIILPEIKNIILKRKKIILERKSKKRKNGCIPARRRIASGGKAGSYADPRTGGKQAYAALKKVKPPGSKGGWTKKKCICCHKCPNDRSAPNGFVCTNPSHLYWGTKADNTYDQNRGNGWAARNKNEMEGDPNGEKAFAYELMISENKIRKIISKILLEDTESEAYFGKKFVDFKKAISAGEEPLEVAKRLLNEIGRGSTRIVFEFPDNPEIVLKIINTEVAPTTQNFIDPEGNVMPNVSDEGDFRTRHGFFRKHMRQSNEWEADLVMQQKFPDVFPKTFEIADDFSWILAEKARPVASLEELISELGITDNFSNSNRIKKLEFLRMISDGVRYFKDPDHPLRSLSESPIPTFLGSDGDSNAETMSNVFSTTLEDGERNSGSSSDTEIFSGPAAYQRAETNEDKRIRELIKDSHNRKILGAMVDLEIPPREFLPKNIGISEITGKLLIIDASLWNEKKKVG